MAEFAFERKEAYVTMITSDDFLPGVEALLESLRESQLIIPEIMRRVVLVMVTSNVSQRVRGKIIRSGASIVEIDSIGIPINRRNSESMNSHLPVPVSHVQSWEATGYSKLNLWSLGSELLGSWEALVYIDADAVVLEELSPIFRRISLENPLVAAPDVFPPDKFNAGVLGVYLEPDQRTFKDMLSQIDTLETYDGGSMFSSFQSFDLIIITTTSDSHPKYLYTTKQATLVF